MDGFSHLKSICYRFKIIEKVEKLSKFSLKFILGFIS